MAKVAQQVLLACVVVAVPRESPDFDPDHHVPDMSDAELSVHEERREPEIGCHWTAALRMEFCAQDGCEEVKIQAFDFQVKAWAYYEAGGLGPPLEEAFAVAQMPREEMHGAFDLCPGLVVTALFVAAEVHFIVHGTAEPQVDFQLMAKEYMYVLQQQKPLDFDAMLSGWPVQLAMAKADLARDKARLLNNVPLTVDIVVARCQTSLRWLDRLPLLHQLTRIFIYEKCRRPEGEVERQTAAISQKVAAITRVSLEDKAEWMTGECTAYLRHMLWIVSESVEPANYTVFIHDDAPRHLKPAFLGLVLRAMQTGMFAAGYMSLAHERYVQLSTPCLRELYRLVMGVELQGRLATYCCGHFVVSASRLREIPVGRLQRLYDAVSMGTYAMVAGGPCAVANMPCYVVEYIWHALLGESDVPPWRSEDNRLPLPFRFEGGRETRLASALKHTMYMHWAEIELK